MGQEDPVEEGMVTVSGIPAWKIPWTEDPGGLQSVGSQRVRHNWSDLAHILYAKHFGEHSVYYWDSQVTQ